MPYLPPSLVPLIVLFVISLSDRVVVQIADITTRPDEAWMLQVARNLVDGKTGVLRGKRYLLLDRDTKYALNFRHLVNDSGTNVIRLPPLSPNKRFISENGRPSFATRRTN